ncbi:O-METHYLTRANSFERASE [Salix purpurea]|uniref:O-METHYLTRANSFERASE n=1 Tax=Salix purpurea TaxID=77065 RepID=A0A9Q0WJY5_SALPP|nr:O-METHYLTRANSFERASE [Salix purpurea]
MDADQGHGVSELFKAQSHLYKHIYYFIESMSLKCAVQLGIPDIIHKNNQPTTLPQLVSALNIPVSKANFLQRLMRILVHSGVFDITKICEDQEGGGGYVLTSSSRLLLKDSPANLSPAVLAVLDPVLLSPWFSLGQWIQGEELTPFEAYHGTSFWEYGKRNIKFNSNLNEAMASDSQVASLSVLLHWSDEDCIKILKRCREAIPSTDDGGKLVLVEMVINDRKDEHELTKTRLFVDMEMMLICNGRGRDEKEWKKLFLEAGFSHYKITATSGLNYIIEVYP